MSKKIDLLQEKLHNALDEVEFLLRSGSTEEELERAELRQKYARHDLEVALLLG